MVSERPCCPAATNGKTEKRNYLANRKTRPPTSTFQKMATQLGTNVKIRKFDGNNFALWKEMMQDVVAIFCGCVLKWGRTTRVSDQGDNERRKVVRIISG
mgnify:CR=1 FL=1